MHTAMTKQSIIQHRKIWISLGLGLLLFPFLANGQVTVTGPSCVTPGTMYQYLISGSWDSTSRVRLCISRGSIVGQSDTCTGDQAPMPFIQVIWNNGTIGSLSLQSSLGNASVQVNITSPLSGGAIADSSKSQTIGYDSIPQAIGCSSSSGGHCSPNYQYQWQLSVDNIQWDDITGATQPQLTISQGLQKTSYCRRKVTETISGSIAYSDAACIIVTQTN